MDADVAVLGAGPAGAGAAFRLATAGHRVVLFERARAVGGAAGSFTVAGVRVDHGSHRLHGATDPAILATLRDLLRGDLQTRPRNGRIRLGDRWVAFPLRAGDLARRLPPAFAAAATRDAVTARLRSPADDTFAEALRARLGPTLCERFYFPYAEKIWGVPPTELSAEQARRRVSADSATKLVRKVVGGAARRSFFYPRSGFGTITERLVEAAAAAGADVRLDTAVERLALEPTGAIVHAGGADVRVARVWSTLPLPALAAVTAPAPPAPVLTAARQLAFRAMVLVYLVLDSPRYTPYDAHYLPNGDTPVTRISEPKNYRDGDDPPDRTVLCAEVPCGAGDAVWRASDGELGRLVVEGAASQGLPPVRPVDVVVKRLPRAYPIYRRGYERAFARLDAWASSQPRLLSFGRQGLFAHDNTHHALAMAWAAADALDGPERFDAGAWRAARERFAEHVVED